jgi:hypothetical protein
MRMNNFIFTLALISLVTGCVTSEKKEVADLCPHGNSPVVKPPLVDQKKIKEGWLFGRYPKADSGPYFKGSLDAVIEKAQKDKKWVVVSIGRDACPLTTRFYHYVESGLVPLDMDKYVYVKLDIDDYEQQDAFCQHFMVEGNLLPFIGLITKDGRATDLHYGYGTSDDFAAFIKEKSE